MLNAYTFLHAYVDSNFNLPFINITTFSDDTYTYIIF